MRPRARHGGADAGSAAAVLVGVVALAGALLVGGGLVAAHHAGPPPTPPSPPASQPGSRHPSPSTRAARSSAAGRPDRVIGPVLPPARPLTITIPRLHVSSPLEVLGVDEEGAMEVPADPARAGWYGLGPAPGSLGPSVVAGHVTWNQVPAVFFRLGSLRPGDVVRIARDDGQVAVFRVSRVATYPKTSFPTRAVFGAVGHAALRLITCGGDYDGEHHRYVANVVAFARLVGSEEQQAQHRGGGS